MNESNTKKKEKNNWMKNEEKEETNGDKWTDKKEKEK